MFWTEWGDNPKIGRANLNGDQRLAIVTTNLHQPSGLDLDKGNQRIIWVNTYFGIVESIDYNGGNRKRIFPYDDLKPTGVTLAPPFLFFTSLNINREVRKLDALTGEVFRSYSINGGEPMGVVVYDGSRQPSGQFNSMYVNTKELIKSILEFYLELNSQMGFIPFKLLMQPFAKTCHHIITSISIVLIYFLVKPLAIGFLHKFFEF